MGKPLIDCTLLSKAEEYAHFKIHSDDHIGVWERFQQKGTAPADMEYEEAPRGRVSYNMKTSGFILLADKCILQKKRIVVIIRSAMNLPKTTKTQTDDHYTCLCCLSRRA